MKNYQGKKQNKNFFKSKFVLIFLLIILIIFISNVIKLAIKAIDTKEKKELAYNRIIELKKQKEKLEYDLQKLNTEKGIEENIREKFGLGKEGEGMIVLVEEENLSELNINKNKNNFFYFLKNLFK